MIPTPGPRARAARISKLLVGQLLVAALVAACGQAPPRSPPSDNSGRPAAPGQDAAPPTAARLAPALPMPAAPPPMRSAEKAPRRLSRGWLGVELGPAPAARSAASASGGGAEPPPPGATVTGVFPQSPAEKAGLTAGDTIVAVDDAPIARGSDLSKAIGDYRAGDRVDITFDRAGTRETVQLELAGMPRGDELTRIALLNKSAPVWDGLVPVRGVKTPELDSYRGKVVVLEFFASWCGACRAMTPTINRWDRRYSGQGLEILGVIPEPVSQALEARKRFGMNYSVASDPTGNTVRAYRAYAVPTLLLLDREGVVRDVVVGFDTTGLRRFEAKMRELVEQS